ncbi:MAG: hypothetical protein K9M57_05740 [Phycisphaerae bacterium]|nr:hypothetical protein [Phycisphaerae bacterium]
MPKPDPFKKMALHLKSQMRNGRTQEFNYLLKGTRNQRSSQKIFLEEKGFKIGFTKAHPGLMGLTDFKKALTLIWENRAKIKGWWHYKKELIGLEICTLEEFNAARDAYFEGPVELFFRKLFGRWF